jgi:hypothetical protein
MVRFMFKREESPDFSKPSDQEAYLRNTPTAHNLLQKELDILKEELLLLQKRIQVMKEFINDIPASDPQYTMLSSQINMDQIEMDELKRREHSLVEKLSTPPA